MSADEEVEQLLRRTRAARERVNSRMAAVGEETRSIRSPLKERNVVGRSTSPTKLGCKSPAKVSSTTTTTSRPSPVRTTTTVKTTVRNNEGGGKEFSERSEETYNREVTEKKTTIVGGGDKPAGGNGETYQKTTITEKEETVQTTEVLKFTGSTEIDPIKYLEERRNRRRQEAAADGVSKQVKFSDQLKTHEISLIDSPMAEECSPKKKMDVGGSGNAWTPNKLDVDYKFNTEDDEDDDGCAAGRRRRLKALASKFREYDDDEEELVVQAKLLADAACSSSPSKRDVTKIVDVDKGIAVASPKLAVNSNPDLVKTLKSQGFQESDSKSKLVYDFGKDGNKAAAAFNPHQFICPPKSAASSSSSASSSSATAPYRSVSPTRMMDPSATKQSGPYSPHHPLHFVSPQRVRSPPPPPPPKPQRTFEDQPPPPPAAGDIASRRSILEKRRMFEEGGGGSSSSTNINSPDPATLPLSQRKALFERNPGALPPKPVARFGQSVTPAMLLQTMTPEMTTMTTVNVPATEPVWKRKREASPQRYLTPKLLQSTSSALNRRFENNRKLFEKNVDETSKEDDNDIAKSIREAKRKDMELLMNRFIVKEKEKSVDNDNYPGVNSLKRIKVSPPKPGQLYPDLNEIHDDDDDDDDDRPGTSMSGETAVSEAPSLGAAIQRSAAAKMPPPPQLPLISEADSFAEASDDINDVLDEALDVTMSPHGDSSTDEGHPTPPKAARLMSTSPVASSTSSWEYQTPQQDFKTPRVDANVRRTSPSTKLLPAVETEDGEATPASELLHTVSFYRKQQKPVQVTPHGKIVRNATLTLHEEEIYKDQEDKSDAIAQRIRKLEEEVEEQLQRRMQSSKALDVCSSKNEFEGSFERVEFERLLLEAHHKHVAASSEIRRLKTEGARRLSSKEDSEPEATTTKGAISISGIELPLKPDFVRMINDGKTGDDSVHYFLCLVKYRAQVIATQMLSTAEGIHHRSNLLTFSNLINVNNLDFDFQIYLEVYALQTPRERLAHEVKYHIIRKEKSMFNLTPLKRLRKEAASTSSTPRNPVNSLTVRKSKFGLVGYTTVTIDTLANKTFELQRVPARSPLLGGIGMRLSVHSESHIGERGFLTMFVDVNGFGNWCRRWCCLRDNTLHFWKYPEDEAKKAPSERVSLHNCVTETPITLAPREICSRVNTLMFDTSRPVQQDDKTTLDMTVDRQRGITTTRHLLMADTRDERINWCNVLTRTLECMRAWDQTSYRPRVSSTVSSLAATTTDGGGGGGGDTTSIASSSSSTDIW